jgi:LMBR1 domain-containing protein 1
MARFLIIFGMIISYLQIFYIPVDVILSQAGGNQAVVDFYVFWGMVCLQLIYVWVICPITIALYESDENDPICKRILFALRIQLPMFFFLLLLAIPTFFFLNKVTVPSEYASTIDCEVNYTDDNGDTYCQMELNFLNHMHTVTVFLGVTILAIFGGIGMVFLPYNLLNDYIYRPKRIPKLEWQKRKGIILKTLVNLRNEGKKLEAENMEVSLMKGLTGYCRRFQFNRKLRVWETCTMLAEREFRKLNNQADFNNKVDSL